MANIPLSTRSTTITLAAASAGPFEVGFRLLEAGALTVYVNGTAREDYTVNPSLISVFSDDATITFTSSLASGDVLVIDGAQAADREYDYENGDPGLVRKINAELGRVSAAVQEIQTGVKSSVRFVGRQIPAVSTDQDGVLAVVDGEPEFILAPDSAAFQAAESAALAQLLANALKGMSVNERVQLSAITPEVLDLGDWVLVMEDGSFWQRVATGGTLNYTGTGGVRLQLGPRDKGIVPAEAFGVIADGVADDTVALQAAVTAAQALVRNAATTKQEDGAVVLLPKGLTKITDTITVSESNIEIRGVSASASAIYAPNASFDLLKFENASFALYNCGVSDLRFLTPGNATAGYALKAMNCIYFNAEGLLFNGAWGGIYIAAGGKLFFNRVTLSQEVRGTATPNNGPSLYFGAEYAVTGDVHFSDLQVMQNVATNAVDSVIMRVADGVYFNNCHIHGGVRIEPRGTAATPAENTIATVVFSGCYFDGSRDVGVQLLGDPTGEYRDIRFDNCYNRGAAIGYRFNPSAPIYGVAISGGLIAQHVEWGVECLNADLVDLKITGVAFDDNNRSDTSLVGDIRLNGSGPLVASCTFNGGDAGGRSVQIDSGANFAQLRNLSWVNSTVPVAQRLANSGANTLMSGLVGYAMKNGGNVAVLSGATSAVVTHGLAVTPVLNSITITPDGAIPNFWISAITSTQFTINFALGLAANRIIGWKVDMEP